MYNDAILFKRRVRLVGESSLGEITVGGLTREEMDIMRAFLSEACMVKVKEGRLVSYPVYISPPAPQEDPVIATYWTSNRNAQLKLVELCSVGKYQDVELYISSLCGYNYSENNYRKEAEKLESFGFNCLRSRRGSDGYYWELWYLPFTDAMKGRMREELKDCINQYGAEIVKRIVSWLCNNVSFGSLDVSVQRAAMVVD